MGVGGGGVSDPSGLRGKKNLSKNKETTILVSSHDIQDVTEVCERIVLLEKGKAIKDIVTSPKTLNELEAYFRG